MEALVLARLQFAFTIAFHIIFPAFSIGLASYLAVLEALWLRTGRKVYLDLFHYWVKIFSLTFGMGVVSGVVMSYQFGTNWSVFSDKAGPIIGPLLAYEVMSAFFLEAGFLGVMLFGRERVGPRLHFFATVMVAIGTLSSAFWILSVNSWMQTPAGFAVNEQGQFVAASWWRVVFTPSFPYRLVHMVLAAYLTTALVVGAVSAFHLLKDRANTAARIGFSMAMWMLATVAPLQILAGDAHGLNTLQHQPAKIAAMEGHFEPREAAPLILFGMPDMEQARTDYAVGIPYLGSLILRHSLTGEVPGLKQFPRDDWPNVPIVFWSFRIMVGLGFLMVTLGAWGLWLRWHRRLFDSDRILKAAILMGPAGFLALLAGWITTEVGRQPWVIYGVMRTADAVSPVGAPAVALSLAAFVAVYAVVFGTGIFYLLRLMSVPPHPTEPPPDASEVHRASGIAPVIAMETVLPVTHDKEQGHEH